MTVPDWSRPLSMAVVQAVAEAEGTTPTDLDRPLGEIIDPDSLNALFDPGGHQETQTPGSVRFTYRGYDVHVHSNGWVEVAEAAERPEPRWVTPKPLE